MTPAGTSAAVDAADDPEGIRIATAVAECLLLPGDRALATVAR
ncbi:hypothetical protein [Cellulomonas chengniuliangii]|uniref:Uncharacterized protein n=1 Tax=Cellulomonas chengniuliangii TaxID=2968084 RepID=A0ABY5L0T7_9CELL|nr:hypothetical protein [Cellulomonas chengniuliangii]UUI76019.1 hypothetical protein NP064_03685 [Cellulomonas chengniuliangii]